MRYAKYDQNTIYMVSKTRNPNLFPKLNIPRSTANYWIHNRQHLKIKIQSSESFTKSELQKAMIKKLILEMKKTKHELQTIKSYLRLLKNNDLIKPPTGPKARFQIVQIIQTNRGRNSIRKILNSLMISFSTYKRWVKADYEIQTSDDYSQKTCRSLTIEEISNLRMLYSSNSLFFYPLHALSTKAKIDRQLFASPKTWQKYINMFKLRRPIILEKPKKKYPIGIMAQFPHELWHIDVTEFKIKKERVFLQAILDNYSRAVLSSQFLSSISAANTLTLIDKTIKDHGSPTKLMSDAGKENVNHKVRVQLERHNVKHIVAKLNTKYSNSKIEVFFRMLKSNYLSHLKISSKSDLIMRIDFYIQNYNYEIPHSALNYRTPDEALRKFSAEHYSNLFAKYRTQILKKRMRQYKKKAPSGA